KGILPVTVEAEMEDRDVKRDPSTHLLLDSFWNPRMRHSRAGTTGRTRTSAGGKARFSASSGRYRKGKGACGYDMGTRRARDLRSAHHQPCRGPRAAKTLR